MALRTRQEIMAALNERGKDLGPPCLPAEADVVHP
jgi:hypothetical protein